MSILYYDYDYDNDYYYDYDYNHDYDYGLIWLGQNKEVVVETNIKRNLKPASLYGVLKSEIMRISTSETAYGYFG